MGDSVSIDVVEKSHDETDDGSRDESNKPKVKPPVNTMEISPNGKYLVTYNKENQTIVGWNIVEEEKDDDMKEGKSKSVKVKKDIPVNLDKEVRHLCVSNQKILAYIYYDDDIGN